MLTFSHVTKKFADFQLNIADLVLRPGEICGLVGHNGAGKSTFLKMAAGLSTADSAEILLDGNRLISALQLREKIAFVPDRPALYDWMTVQQFVSFLLSAGSIDPKKIGYALDIFAVPLTKQIRNLSHGTRNKVGLAAALARRGSFVLMDEPLSGLDMKSRDELLDQILQIAHDVSSSKGILFSSHTVSDLEQIAQSVVIIRQGSIVLTSSMEDIQTKWLVVKQCPPGLQRVYPLRQRGAIEFVVKEPDLNGMLAGISISRRATSLDVFLAVGS